MKKYYMLLVAIAFMGMAGAQELLIDEGFGAHWANSAWGNIDVTTADGQWLGVNVRKNNNNIDIERDDRTEAQGGAGYLLLPEVASCSKVEISIRSVTNANPIGNRWAYIASYDGTNFTRLTENYDAPGSDNGGPLTHENTDEVVSSVPIQFAIRTEGGGAVRIESIKVWSAGSLVSAATPSINVNAVSVEFYNMSGSNVGSDWNALPAGIYVSKTTYDNGSVVTDKVSKARK